MERALRRLKAVSAGSDLYTELINTADDKETQVYTENLPRLLEILSNGIIHKTWFEDDI